MKLYPTTHRIESAEDLREFLIDLGHDKLPAAVYEGLFYHLVERAAESKFFEFCPHTMMANLLTMENTDDVMDFLEDHDATFISEVENLIYYTYE